VELEGSCKNIEQAVADSRQGVLLQLGDWTWDLYSVKDKLKKINVTFGILIPKGKFTHDSCKRNIKIKASFNGSTGGQMGQGWHGTNSQIYILLLKLNENHELDIDFLV
jgi:hypothetical protein